MAVALFAARICGVRKEILQRAKIIRQERQIEYALGFTVWFLLYRLRVKLPAYNIYHLVPASEKDFYLKLLNQRIDEYRVSKQYWLLQSEQEITDDFRGNVKTLLEKSIRSPRKNTAFKTRRFNTASALEALCRIDDTLKTAGLNPFLVSGTLLGVIRDNALIEGDNDLDIGIRAEEASSEEIFGMLVGNPAFRSVYNLGHLVQVTDHNGTVIDIFIHYQEDGGVWHGTDVHQWLNSDFGLREMEFQSHTFLVPDDARLYLDENYGNWTQPVLFWDYSFDTPNRRFFTNRKTVYYLAERILGELNRKKPSRHTVQTAIEELNHRFDIDLSAHLGRRSTTQPANPKKARTVITFGTFDLFHIGHLNILQRAAACGDRLVVGVSSDALNFGKKQSYPVYRQEDRIRIVSSIDYVSEVFYEESLELKEEYIRKFGADVLVMGDDWKGKFDHLGDVCEVVYLSRTENISTSETKDSIKRNL